MFFARVLSMAISKILENYRVQKIGDKPVVVLPLDIWHEIEDRLENLEMSGSENLRKKVAQARKEKKLYSSLGVRKLLST